MNAERQPSDQAARDRIQRDLGTSFAVEAGAGTGKTAVLTGRIVEAVRTDRATLGRIVAITFTERAASELKVRLRTALEAALAEAHGNAAKGLADAERLAGALGELDAARASTIHSFAAEILRERPVEAGVDPAFSIADEMEASLLFDDVWADWLAGQLADENGPLRAAFIAGLTTDNLKTFARRLEADPDLEPAGDDADVSAEAERAAGEYVAKARALYEQTQAVCESPACSCAKRIRLAAQAANALAGRDRDAVLARLPTVPGVSITRPQKACKEHKESCKAALNELEGLVAGLRGPAGHTLVLRTTAALREMLDAYAAAKRERGLLDFDDLLRKARDLLRDDKAVRRYFQRQFELILVDECQDTDPLQTEIVFFLAENGAKADEWRAVRTTPGKLLFVGDPKQSIYRFRRADIEMYEEAKAVMARSGTLETISQNFRSSPACVGWVNAVFGALIQRPDDGAYQPDYVPLAAWREDDGPAVTVLRPPEETIYDSIGEARAAEAAAIADHIRRAVEAGETVPDKATRTMRPVAYGDFALLLRTRTALDTYETALGGAGVPFRTVSGRDFFAKQEVVELRLVLTAIARPHDALAVVAALRTSVLGVSDDELAAAADGGFNYLAREAAEPESYIEKVFRLLAGWHRDRCTCSISRLVQRVLSDTKALALFYLKPNGEQRAANLSKVIDAARSYEQESGATFGGFVRWLDERSTVAEEAESPLAADGDGFVRLMTIHQAKGLEFPVVVLPDLSSQPNGGIGFVVNRRAGTFEARVGPKSGGVQTAGFDDASGREKRVQEAEARRVFYVAATRARDRLVLPHFPKKGKAAGYLKYLADLADDLAAAEGIGQTEKIIDPDSLKAGGQDAFRTPLPEVPPKGCKKLIEERDDWLAKRATLIKKSCAGKQLRTASALHEGDYEDFGHAASESEGEDAKAVGKAVHAVLEQIDLKTGGGLAALAEEEAQRQDIAGQAALVERLAANALQMPAVKRAAEASTLYREVPFAVNIGGTILEGKIDLAFDDGSGLEIMDYKTDDVAEDRLAEHARNYRLQVGAYALAAREVLGALPKSVSLLFLRAGREVPVELADALLASVAEKL